MSQNAESDCDRGTGKKPVVRTGGVAKAIGNIFLLSCSAIYILVMNKETLQKAEENLRIAKESLEKVKNEKGDQLQKHYRNLEDALAKNKNTQQREKLQSPPTKKNSKTTKKPKIDFVCIKQQARCTRLFLRSMARFL